MNKIALLHLMHLVSPALPVGAYAYSQGFESATELGWVHDEASAAEWIENVMRHALGQLDLPILLRLHRAWKQGALDQVGHWNHYLQAARESHELLQEDVQMGAALQRLLADLSLSAAKQWPIDEPSCFATQFALAASYWEIDEVSTLNGFCWSWLENQIAAAIKLVPLGQTKAQKILLNLMTHIPSLVDSAITISDANIGSSLPRVAMASMQHEHQYSRLFRS